jgi:hypothetical protein
LSQANPSRANHVPSGLDRRYGLCPQPLGETAGDHHPERVRLTVCRTPIRSARQAISERSTNKQSEPVHDGQQGAMPAAARRIPAPLAFVTTAAFQATGAPVTGPVTEGLEPQAGTTLQPAEPETTMHHDRARKYGRIPAGIAVAWLAGRSEETTPAAA